MDYNENKINFAETEWEEVRDFLIKKYGSIT